MRKRANDASSALRSAVANARTIVNALGDTEVPTPPRQTLEEALQSAREKLLSLFKSDRGDGMVHMVNLVTASDLMPEFKNNSLQFVELCRNIIVGTGSESAFSQLPIETAFSAVVVQFLPRRIALLRNHLMIATAKFSRAVGSSSQFRRYKKSLSETIKAVLASHNEMVRVYEEARLSLDPATADKIPAIGSFELDDAFQIVNNQSADSNATMDELFSEASLSRSIEACYIFCGQVASAFHSVTNRIASIRTAFNDLTDELNEPSISATLFRSSDAGSTDSVYSLHEDAAYACQQPDNRFTVCQALRHHCDSLTDSLEARLKHRITARLLVAAKEIAMMLPDRSDGTFRNFCDVRDSLLSLSCDQSE